MGVSSVGPVGLSVGERVGRVGGRVELPQQGATVGL